MAAKYMTSVPTVTTDGYISNRSHKVVKDGYGIVHYSVLITELPAAVINPTITPPCIVQMCQLLDAYDRAQGWHDFVYPTWTMGPDQEYDGAPTCIRCSSA